MFKKTQRLSREDISEILNKEYEKINSQYFFVKVSPTLQNTEPKFSIIVSKKVAKLAVRRHLLKRKVVNILQNILKENNITNNSYIISLKSDISDVDNEEIKNELVKILN